MNMNEGRREIYRKALKKWGEVSQIHLVFEEIAELQKELVTYLRQPNNKKGDYELWENISEEIADCQIMLEQLIILFDNRKQVEWLRARKLKRLNKRLKDEGENEI
jgi:hypothetical protein